MQAIRTRYHAPSGSKGARISATCEARRVYFGWQDKAGVAENHQRAALAFAKSRGWKWRFVGGSFDGDMYWTADAPVSPVADNSGR